MTWHVRSPRRRAAITKSATTRPLPVLKADEDHRLVIGVALEAGVEDHQGDTISAAELTRVASRSLGAAVKINHNGPSVGRITMSLALTPEVRKAIAALPESAGYWIVGLSVDNETAWKAAKAGLLRGGLSIGGTVRRTQVK